MRNINKYAHYVEIDKPNKEEEKLIDSYVRYNEYYNYMFYLNQLR